MTADLIAQADADPNLSSRSTLVYAGEGWHQGIVGIVANHLVDRFGKPSAVIAINDGQAKGSLRSIPSVHLGEAIEACRHVLTKGGGHAVAAGITLEASQIEAFKDAFERHVASRVAPGSLMPYTEYDAEVALSDLDSEFLKYFEAIGPFGMGNREPVLRLANAAFAVRPKLIGKNGEHLKGPLTDTGGGMKELFVWRGKAIFGDVAAPGRRLDLLVRPEIHHWQGASEMRLVFVDGRPA